MTCSTCTALVNRTTSTSPRRIARTASVSGPVSSGSLHWYTGTRMTIAPRASIAFSSSTFGTPYSCTATLIPFSDRPRSSSALIRSRHVFGSGTASVGCRLFSRSTAKGLGPRTTVMVLPRAASNCTRGQRVQLLAALGKTITVVRGPKPLAVLRENNLQPTLAVPEPNTWRDLIKALDDLGRSLKGMSVAVQEYGVPNVELLKAIEARGAIVMRVPVYQWRLPEDTGPLTDAVRAILRGEVDVVLFTNAVQVDHVMQMAERVGGADRLRQVLEKVVVSAVGPIVAERLSSYELPVDFEPSHPKMGIHVKETSERAAELL